MWIYTDTQTIPVPVDADKDTIPAGFKAALKARLLAQGPMRMPDAVTWGLNYCIAQGAPNVAVSRIRTRITNIMEEWHPAPVEPTP